MNLSENDFEIGNGVDIEQPIYAIECVPKPIYVKNVVPYSRNFENSHVIFISFDQNTFTDEEYKRNISLDDNISVVDVIPPPLNGRNNIQRNNKNKNCCRQSCTFIVFFLSIALLVLIIFSVIIGNS